MPGRVNGKKKKGKKMAKVTKKVKKAGGRSRRG